MNYVTQQEIISPMRPGQRPISVVPERALPPWTSNLNGPNAFSMTNYIDQDLAQYVADLSEKGSPTEDKGKLEALKEHDDKPLARYVLDEIKNQPSMPEEERKTLIRWALWVLARRPSPVRQGTMWMVVKRRPTVMLTIAFVRPLSDEEAIANLWYFLKQVNKRIWHRGFWKHRTEGFTGLIFAEPHARSWHLRGSIHFHILLQGDPAIADLDYLKSQLLAEIPFVLDLGEKQVMHEDLIDVRPIWDVHGIAGYVTKCMGHPEWSHGDYVFPLDPRGIAAMGSRSYRKMIDY